MSGFAHKENGVSHKRGNSEWLLDLDRFRSQAAWERTVWRSQALQRKGN